MKTLDEYSQTDLDAGLYPTREECGVCKRSWPIGDPCLDCAKKYPHSLYKATYDPFNYRLRLQTGEVIYFEEAEIRGEWVHLSYPHGAYGPNPEYDDGRLPGPRGTDVRLTDIVWCEDCGS